MAEVLLHPRSPNAFSRPGPTDWFTSGSLRGVVARAQAWFASCVVSFGDRRQTIATAREWKHPGRVFAAVDLLALYHSGVSSPWSSEERRNGAAEVASGSANDPKYFDECLEILRVALNDGSKEVRRTALGVFRLEGLLEMREAAVAFNAGVHSRAFRDDPSPLLWALREHKGPLAPFADSVLAVCDVFTQDLAAESRDLRTSISGDAHFVPDLLLRLYAEADGRPELRRACLDRCDAMLRSRMGRLGDALEKVDQR